ncbi:putative ankyrin repeat protein [Megavirus lba]|uniref:Putative ankyrin repeat protein n=1 Tax=Megavirus lba TaxID=1235314 RepID=L7XWV8_9VIRU|nr:putative ankyrin repeat protein [Megavirus lba]
MNNNTKYYAFYNETNPNCYYPQYEPGFNNGSTITFVSIENILQGKKFGTHIAPITIPRYVKFQYSKSTQQYYSKKYIIGDLMKFTDTLTIQMLIDNGADVENSGNLLCWAAANNHLNIIKYIIKISETIDKFNGLDALTRYNHIISTQNFNTETKFFDRCLIIAIQFGHLNIVKYLFNNKSSEKLYIWITCIHGHLDIFKFFIESRFDIQFDDNIYLMTAIVYNKSEIVKYIESFGIKVSDQITKCIKLVINRQHNDFFKSSMKVKFLKTVGVNYHTLYQILLAMCEVGCYNSVKYLIESGVKPTNSCLKIILRNNHSDLIELFANNQFD